MYEFNYQKPTTVSEAAAMLAASADGQLLAGGHSLIPTMKQRLAAPSDLIDLAAISELEGSSLGEGSVTVGAMMKHAEVMHCPDVSENIPALSDLASGIGDAQVRNRGTIGGSIAQNDPAADYPAALVGLGATVNTNQRSIAADDFFVGLFETALNDDEIIVSIDFPIPDQAAYCKFPNPASRYAIVGVFVSQGPAGVRVAVTGAGASAYRVSHMEAALTRSFAPESVANISVSADGLNSDLHASAEYRAHLITVMAKRAVAKATA